jgi:hypothetical protein
VAPDTDGTTQEKHRQTNAEDPLKTRQPQARRRRGSKRTPKRT